jgi:hypothetical membrane protein
MTTLIAAPDLPPSPERTGRSSTRVLLACGAIAGPLFVAVLLLAGATRPHYHALRHPGSSLALGEFGWIQDVNFVVAGLLTLAFAVGLRRVLKPARGAIWGPILIGWWAVGLLGAGVFVTDPVSGYPPGTPDQVTHPTVHGALHDLFSVPAFLALFVAFLVLGRRFRREGRRGWATYCVVSAVLFIVAFVGSGVAFQQVAGLVDYGGLAQRVGVVVGWAWLTLLALHLFHAAPALRSRSNGRTNRPRRGHYS